MRRWWALKAAATRGVERIRRGQLDATDDGQRQQHGASGAGADVDQPGQLVAGHQVEQRGGGDQGRAGEIVRRRSRVMSDRRVSTRPRRRRRRAGRSAAAICSRSASRSCSTQCCGPGSSGASQRPIAPVPQREVVDHQRPVAGRCRRSCSTRSRRAGGGVGGLAQGEPVGADPDRLRRSSRRSRQDARDDGRGGRPAGQRRAPLARGPAQPLAAARRRRARRAARRRARPGRPGGTSRPGRSPSGAVAERLRHAADLGGDDRQAAGQRLGDDHAVRLGRARPAPAGRRRRSCGRARRRSAAPGSAPGRPARRRGRGGGAARRTPGRGRGCRRTRQLPATGRSIVASASSSTSWPLPGSPPRRRAAPRRSRCRARARRRRRRARRRAPGRPAARTAPAAGAGVHALVVTTAAAAASTAPSRAAASPSVVPAQRHVHEHDQPQPARLRHQHLRGRRGDQPVEQHHGAVGDPPDDVGERGVRRRVGPRPAPGTACTCTVQPSAPARGRRGGRRRCRRSAGPGRRCRRGRRRAPRVTAPARSSPRRRATRAA